MHTFGVIRDSAYCLIEIVKQSHLKSMRFNSFMYRNQRKLLYQMGNIFVSL